MKRLGKKELLADGLLLLTALIWGSAFAVVKNTLDIFPPAAIIAMRYTIATALTGIAFRKHLRALTREDILRGALVGLLLSAAYIVQTIGLSYTTASKNAFLTAVYVMLVPFFSMVLFRQRLRKANFIAAAMMLLGIGLLSLDGESGGLNVGDVLTLLCGALFAGHIIAVERCQRRTDAYALIVLQFGFCAVYALVYALLFERGMPMSIRLDTVGGGLGGRAALSGGLLHDDRHEPAEHRAEHGPGVPRLHPALAGIGVRRDLLLPAAGGAGDAADAAGLCGDLRRADGQRADAP